MNRSTSTSDTVIALFTTKPVGFFFSKLQNAIYSFDCMDGQHACFIPKLTVRVKSIVQEKTTTQAVRNTNSSGAMVGDLSSSYYRVYDQINTCQKL